MVRNVYKQSTFTYKIGNKIPDEIAETKKFYLQSKRNIFFFLHYS